MLEFFLGDLLLILGAKDAIGLAVVYARIVFAGTLFMLFNGSAYVGYLYRR